MSGAFSSSMAGPERIHLRIYEIEQLHINVDTVLLIIAKKAVKYGSPIIISLRNCFVELLPLSCRKTAISRGNYDQSPARSRSTARQRKRRHHKSQQRNCRLEFSQHGSSPSQQRCV